MIRLIEDRLFTLEDLPSILKVACTKGTSTNNKKQKYRNIIAAFDIETTSFIDDNSINYNDNVLYNMLHNTTIKVSDIDIDTYKSITPTGLKISKNKGYALDELYADLSSMFPYYFPDDVLSPDTRLKLIFDIYSENIPYKEVNEKHAIMYCWQLAIDGHVIFGRTWSEFLEAISLMESCKAEDERIIIWVHNLQFEFQFIRKFFKWKKVFSVSPRKPIYAITNTNIEFRCSYILTNYSLSKLADQLQHYKVKKLVGSLDYSLYRHPETPLSAEEIQYCINDVLVVSAYIQEQIKIEGRITNIPLTATGYCRRYCRKMCFGKSKRENKYKQYNALMQRLTISNEDEYYQLKRAFQGGFTHASCLHVGKTLKGVLASIDFTSSYPYVLLSEPHFPMSAGTIVKIKSEAEFNNYLSKYCCIFDIDIEDIKAKFINENYISVSHCYNTAGVISNNGRLVSADKITTTITELDYKIIKRTYNMKKITIHNFRIYERGYLPIDIIKSIIKLYKDKTVLKGVEGKEQEYLNSKALINAVFGMMCTDMCKDEIVYSEDIWDIEKCDIKKAITKYNNSGNRFTFYPWGIYTTALARYNLWSGILAFGDDYIYSDTDSIKCFNIDDHMNYIDAYNNNCKKKLQLMCKYYQLDYADLEPVTIEGEKKPLGVWDIESTNINTFKTLGAKRYMYMEGDKLKMTVAGVNKKAALPYLINTYGEDVFTAFQNGLEIPPDDCGKMTHCYIDIEQKGTITDYLGNNYKYTSYSGIYLEKVGFKFNISPEFISFIKGIQYYK